MVISVPCSNAVVTMKSAVLIVILCALMAMCSKRLDLFLFIQRSYVPQLFYGRSSDRFEGAFTKQAKL